MPLVVPLEGQLYLLEALLSATDLTAEIWLLNLYTNVYSPKYNSVLADFVTATYAGYAAIPLTRAKWSLPVTVANRAVSVWGDGSQFFRPTSGSQTVYGYYVTDPTATVCLWAESIGQYTLTPGNPLYLYPQMQLFSESQPT